LLFSFQQCALFLFFSVLLLAFVAFCAARPVVFLSEMTDTNLVNTTNGWSGVSMLWATSTKGKNNHRVRVFGVHNINDTITGAYIAHANGTKLVTLKWARASTDRYILGDSRVNETVYGWVLNQLAQVVVTSTRFPNGAIGGILYSSPGLGLTFLDGAQAGVSSTSVGMGLAWYRVTNNGALPIDLIAQTNAVVSGLTFSGRVIHNVTSSVSSTYNGPANTTTTAPVLFTLSTVAPLAYSINRTPATTVHAQWQQLGLTYFAVNNAAGVNIRGQVYPILGLTRRAIPTELQTVTGISNIPVDGFETLRYANLEVTQRNGNSIVSCVSTQTGGVGNYTYQGEFFFPTAASRRNFEGIRSLLIDLNVRIVGSAATWNFDWFDSSTGAHVPAGTFSTVSSNWTEGVLIRFNPDVVTFSNNRAQQVVRVTVNSATPTTLWLDLFAIRSYTPSAVFNQIFKTPLKQLLLLPTK